MTDIESGKTKKPTKEATHPKYSKMVATAIETLKERGGSSRAAIIKFITSKYKVSDIPNVVNHQLKLALKNGVKSGSLTQVKGTGATGSFKLAKKAAEKPKKVVKSPKKAKSNKKAAKQHETVKSSKTVAKSPKKVVKSQVNGTGASGSFKLAKKATEKPKKVKSPKAVKSPKKAKSKKVAAKMPTTVKSPSKVAKSQKKADKSPEQSTKSPQKAEPKPETATEKSDQVETKETSN